MVRYRKRFLTLPHKGRLKKTSQIYLRRPSIVSVLIILFLISAGSLWGVDYTWNAGADGDWDVEGNWRLVPSDGTDGNDGYPDGNDDRATIGTPHTVSTLGADLTIGELTISDAGAVLTLDQNLSLDTTTHTGKLDVAGTVNVGANTLDVDGDVDGSGDLNNAAGGTINFGGDLGITTYAHNTGSEVFDGTTSLEVGTSYTFYDITVSGTLNTNSQNMTVVLNILGAGFLNTTAGETITVGRNFTVSNFNESSSEVIFDTAAVADVSAHTFYDLTLDKTGGSVSFNGDLSVTNSMTVNGAAYNVSILGANNSITGATTFNNTGTLNLGDGGDNIAFPGGLTATAPATLNLDGNLSSTDTSISLGDTDLLGNSTISTGSGLLSLGTIDGGFNLVIDTTGGVNAGTITFGGAIGIGTPLANLTVTSKDAVALPSTAVTGDLTVTASGDITQSGAVDAGGTTLDAGANNITLTLANTFGNLTVTGGVVQITESDAITDGGAWSTTGTTTLDAGANDITLDVATSTTGSLDLTGVTATVDRDGAIDIVGGTVTTLDLTSGTGISDSGTITVTNGLTATGDANGAGITLDQIDVTGGTVSLTTTDSDATISNGSAIQFAASNVGNNLSATAGTGDITQSGALTVSGTASFTVPDTQNIYLETQANNIGGAPTFATSGVGNISNLGYRNVNAGATLPSVGNIDIDVTIIFDATGVVLPAMTIGGDLAVTAGGIISDSGDVSVTGSGIFNAGVNAIILGDGTNADFADLDVTGGIVQVTENSATTLAGVSATSLTLSSGGDITDAAGTTIAVTNVADFTANGGLSAITLGDSAGDTTNFGSLDATGTTVTISEDSGTTIAGGTITDLNLTSAGVIDDSGPVSVSGTATLNAGVNNITLTDGANDFATVTVNGGAGTVQITDADDIVLGGTGAAVTSLAVVAGGAVTQSGAITGTTLYVATDGAGGPDITLGNGSNDFDTVSLETLDGGSDAAGAINYADTDGYDLGTDATGGAGIRTTSTVSLSGGGALTQTGEVIAAGNTTTLTFGGGNDISLVDADNDFATVAVASGNNVQLIDTNDMAIGGSTISGTFDATATGATLTVSGAVGGPVGETTLNGDDMVITGSINAGVNTVFLLPDTNNTAVSIEGGAAFDLSEGELTSITAGLIEVGRDGTPTVTAGAVSVVPGGNADVGGRNITISGTSITVGGGSNTLTSTGTITLLTNGSIQGGNDDGTADVDAGILIMDADGAGGIGSTTTLDASIGTRVDADTTGGNGDIAIDFIGNTDVGTINAGSGDVTLAGTGSIDDDGANTPDIMGGTVNLSGTTLGTVDTIETDATNLIINTSAGNAVITEADDLVIAGVSSVAGNLNLDLNAGNLTQTNTLAVTGTTTLTTTGNITLAAAGNDFDDNDSGDAVTINGGVATDISIRDTDDMRIAAIANARDLTVQSGGTITQTGNFDLAGDFTLIGGTFDTGGFGITLEGDWDNNGNFTHGSGTITFDGGVPQSVDSGGTSGRFNNLTVSDGSTLTVTGTEIYVDGTLTTSAAVDTIDMAGLDFDVEELDNNGVFRLEGNQTTQDVNTSQPASNIDGTVEYYSSGSDGTVDIRDDLNNVHEYNNLVVDAGGHTISLTDATDIYGNLSVTGGTFDLANYDFTCLTTDGTAGDIDIQVGATLDADDAGSGTNTITVGRDWSNAGTFEFRDSSVVFTRSGGTIQVSGSNTFYRFECTIAGLNIEFETGQTQTIVPGGEFRVEGSVGNRITLDRIAPPPDRWILDMQSGATLTMQYVDVYWSEAAPNRIIIPNLVSVFNCIDWISFLPVDICETRDLDSNGKIDRIMVQAPANFNDDFSDFEVSVDGYTVLGYSTYDDATNDPGDEKDQMFYILLEEKSYLDTGIVPTWRIETNTSLYDDATTSKLLTIDDPPDDEMDAADIEYSDGAAPIIGYTLAFQGGNKVFVHFSEEVQVDGTGPPPPDWSAGNFGYGGATLTVVTGSITQIKEVELTGTPALDTIPPGDNVTVPSGAGDTQDAAGNLIVSGTHRISDIGLGIIEPVYAINTATQRDADRSPNIGRITNFDGSDWLQPQELQIESSVSGTSGDVRLHFDFDVGSRFISGDNPGLWLPSFDESVFSGIVPFPKTSGVATDSDEDGSDAIAVHTISSSSGKLKDGKTFEFFYEYPDGGVPPLYHARCEDESAIDWYRRIRPFSFDLQRVRQQTGSVSILHNVIDPREGEKVDIHYILDRGGSVTIQVFNLGGDLIEVLERGRKSPGEYAISWDGRNQAGNIVARGIYYIRVTAPDIDEYRKVLVVK